MGASEAARTVGVSAERIRQLVRDGRLPALKTPIGSLLHRSDVERLAQARRAAQHA